MHFPFVERLTWQQEEEEDQEGDDASSISVLSVLI